MQDLFVFWDNSNIHYTGLNLVRPALEPGSRKELYRTYFRNLFELVRNGRLVANAWVAGSDPAPGDAVWEYVRTLGINLTLLDRTASGHEQGSVDMLLQLNMLRAICDHAPSTVALLTGDGAGGRDGTGFLADLQRMHRAGWQVEVYAWEHSCNRHLKAFANKQGLFVPLERHYHSITFLQGSRVVQPLEL